MHLRLHQSDLHLDQRHHLLLYISCFIKSTPTHHNLIVMDVYALSDLMLPHLAYPFDAFDPSAPVFMVTMLAALDQVTAALIISQIASINIFISGSAPPLLYITPADFVRTPCVPIPPSHTRFVFTPLTSPITDTSDLVSKRSIFPDLEAFLSMILDAIDATSDQPASTLGSSPLSLPPELP